ncbi:hypothetical protein vseg_016983 [Gypsophila vaccaria]
MSQNLIPNSPQNPNPTPKIDSIAQNSSLNCLKIVDISPNWLLLPDDVWFSILSKLYTCDIVENVQKVCKLFRKICTQPSMFRVIKMMLNDGDMALNFDVNVMTRHAVDRSGGDLVDVYLEYCDDETLLYLVERSKKLKHLRIGQHAHISDDVLVEAVKKLPVLEEVEIFMCDFSAETIKDLGDACPSLKSFSLNTVGSKREFIDDEEALAIAVSMPNLRHLQLIGNCMSNEGLDAILDGCSLLESLDLRACYCVELYGAIANRCNKIKHFRHPDDSTDDYSHEACTDRDYLSDSSSDEEPEYNYDEIPEYGMCYSVPEYVDIMDTDMYIDDGDGDCDGDGEYTYYDYCGCDCFGSDSD